MTVYEIWHVYSVRRAVMQPDGTRLTQYQPMTTLWKSLGDRELAERELIRLRHNYGSTYELRERDAND